MKHSQKSIQSKLEKQYNIQDRRPTEKHRDFSAPEPYTEPLKFFIDLVHHGKHVSDAIYITRLVFTNPETPHYVPIERWNSVEFARYTRRWFKAD